MWQIRFALSLEGSFYVYIFSFIDSIVAWFELNVNIFHICCRTFYNSDIHCVYLWVIILIFIYILWDHNALTLIWVIVFVPTRVWKHVVEKGDTVIDATCGNGFDTLALRNLVADESHNGYVYALDIQKDALDKTSLLLEESLSSNEVRTTEEWRFQLSIGVECGSVLFRRKKKKFSQRFHFVFTL